MRFEYKVEGGVSEERMNELGAQGWELVSVEGGRFTFKRPKSQEQMPPRELFGKAKDDAASRKR